MTSLFDAHVGSIDFIHYGPYEIADLLKLYFRELPEPLLTNKTSEVLFVIHESKQLLSPCFMCRSSDVNPNVTFGLHKLIKEAFN